MTQTNKTPLPEGRIWFVRAERNNILAGCFLEKGVVGLGWGIGALEPDEPKSEIIQKLAERFHDANPKTIDAWASQIKRFNERMAVGDAVATYDSEHRLCHIGIIRALLIPSAEGPPPEYEMDYVHRVEWQHQVSRDDLSGPAWRGLVNPQSFFLLSEATSAELRGLCAPAK